MKNLLAPFLILIVGPAAAVIFYVGGFQDSIDRHTLKLALFQIPLGAFFVLALLRGRLFQKRNAEHPMHSNRFSSILDGIEIALASTAIVYFVFFQFGAK